MSHWIVGPGALGRMLAVYLAGKLDVSLLGRRAPPSSITLTTPAGERLTRQVSVGTLGPGPLTTDLSTLDVIHLTTKAYAAEAAVGQLLAGLETSPPLVLWQNGYGVQETLTRHWPGPVVCASTSEGAYLEEPSLATVTHAGHGQTFLGHLDGEYTDFAFHLAETLTSVGLPSLSVADMRQRLWHKLAVNAAINPLVARYRIRNGELRERQYRPMVDAVIEEVTRLLDAEAILAPAEGLHARVWQVIEGTANNRASMLQDVLVGRPTEREAILGPLLDAARRHQLPCPTLEALDRSLSQLS
ncbi:ketopantoate reductase family protein [Litchfieldella xinjiangensis]|uniref:ketopantoate reductase family protein n=1 Tax=Litchfieldella xinjiangensis TaxID=1166948 RepID=UPI0005BB866C|nr:2-dehydropantoate 2-reductase [Halomonas xinjiangensis]